MTTPVDVYYDPQVGIFYLEYQGKQYPALPETEIKKDLESLGAHLPTGKTMDNFISDVKLSVDKHGRIGVDAARLASYPSQGVIKEGFYQLRDMIASQSIR